MAITKEDVLEFISNLSVLELSELVKEFEEKFGVSAAPVMVAGGAVAAGGAAAALCYPADALQFLLPQLGFRLRPLQRLRCAVGGRVLRLGLAAAR